MPRKLYAGTTSPPECTGGSQKVFWGQAYKKSMYFLCVRYLQCWFRLHGFPSSPGWVLSFIIFRLFACIIFQPFLWNMLMPDMLAIPIQNMFSIATRYFPHTLSTQSAGLCACLRKVEKIDYSYGLFRDKPMLEYVGIRIVGSPKFCLSLLHSI